MPWNSLSFFLIFSLAGVFPGTSDASFLGAMPDASAADQFHPEVQFNFEFGSKENQDSITLQVTEDDSDGDGLDDSDEAWLGTNPYSVDSDCDGLLDRTEVQDENGVIAVLDQDSDGIVDGMESQNADSDGDGTLDPQDPETAIQVVCGKFQPFAVSDNESTTFSVTAVTPGVTGLIANTQFENHELYDDGTHGDVTAGDRVFTREGIKLPEQATCCMSVTSMEVQSGDETEEVDSYSGLFVRTPQLVFVPPEDLLNDIQQIDGLFVSRNAVAIVDPELAALVWSGRVSEAATRFLELFGDNHDFIQISPQGGGNIRPSGFHSAVRNKVEGIGLPIYGSDSTERLLAIQWQNNSGGPGAATHEIMHQWQAYVGQELGFGQCSGAHWGIIGQGRGVMGGFDPDSLTETSPGQYVVSPFSACCGVGRKYTPLELYFAGLAPPSEVLPIDVPLNVDCASLSCTTNRCTFEAEGIDTVTIDELIELEGARMPGFGDAPTNFNMAHVLIADKPPTSAELSVVAKRAVTLEDPDQAFSFYQVSSGRGSVDTAVIMDPAPQRGLYWDRSRNGHGLDFQKSGDTYFFLFYTYRDDKTPVWYLANGKVNNGVFEGIASQFDYDASRGSTPQKPISGTGGPVAIDFNATRTAQACQDGVDRSSAESIAVMKFDLDGHAGEWCIEPFIFADNGNPSPNMTGSWFDGTDPGWGMTVYTQGKPGTTLVVVLYYYDDDGQPRWAIGVGQDYMPGVPITLDMMQFSGFCLSCDPVEQQPGVNSGQLTLELIGPSTIPIEGNSTTFDVLYKLPPGGQWQRTDARIHLLSDPAN